MNYFILDNVVEMINLHKKQEFINEFKIYKKTHPENIYKILVQDTLSYICENYHFTKRNNFITILLELIKDDIKIIDSYEQLLKFCVYLSFSNIRILYENCCEISLCNSIIQNPHFLLKLIKDYDINNRVIQYFLDQIEFHETSFTYCDGKTNEFIKEAFISLRFNIAKEFIKEIGK